MYERTGGWIYRAKERFHLPSHESTVGPCNNAVSFQIYLKYREIRAEYDPTVNVAIKG